MTTTEDYSPIAPGDTLVPFSPQFLHKDGTPVDLTGCSLTMEMRNQDSGNIRTGTGVWTIDDATNGKAHYHYSAADVETAGFYDLVITITKDGETIHADTKVLEIRQA